MIDPLLLVMLAKAGLSYEPPPAVFYPQAIGCAASAHVAKGKDPNADEAGEMMTWGLVLADMGRKAGRTAAQIDGDAKAALPFYQRLKAKKPPAFAGHRAYCRALLDADRP